MGFVTYYQLENGKESTEYDIDKSCFQLSEGLKKLKMDGYYIVLGFTKTNKILFRLVVFNRNNLSQ